MVFKWYFMHDNITMDHWKSSQIPGSILELKIIPADYSNRMCQNCINTQKSKSFVVECSNNNISRKAVDEKKTVSFWNYMIIL